MYLRRPLAQHNVFFDRPEPAYTLNNIAKISTWRGMALTSYQLLTTSGRVRCFIYADDLLLAL